MRKHKLDFSLLLLVLALMVMGAIVIFAVGPRVAIFENSIGADFSEDFFIKRHLIAILFSIVAIAIGVKVPIEKLKQSGKWFLLVGLALCLGVFVFGRVGAGFVTCDEGACRAFRFGPFGFQPIEVVKIGILLYISWLIRDRKERDLLDKSDFWLPLGVTSAVVAFVSGVLLKDFGSVMVIVTMIFYMMFIAGVPLKNLGIAIAICGVAFLFLIVFSPHRRARLANYFGAGDEYHITGSLIAMGTGGLTGVGLGNSIQSTGYLPETLSDSIFAIICEVWGLVGATLTLLFFAGIIARIFKISKHSPDKENSYICLGVFAWVLAHVIINVGGMTGITPMKGITLPFLSYGGTSMMFISFAIGVVLQISTWTKREAINNNENTSSWRGQRRSRYAGHSRRS